MNNIRVHFSQKFSKYNERIYLPKAFKGYQALDVKMKFLGMKE